MKSMLLIVFFILPFLGISQTEEIENENFQKLINEGKFTSEEVEQAGRAWNEIVRQYGGFPVLPYDPDINDLRYENVYAFDELSNEVIFHRILEWAAIKINESERAIMYQNLESGKIVIKGVMDVVHHIDYTNFWGSEKEKTSFRKCRGTFIFTVANHKVKIDIRDLKLLVYLEYSGYYQNFTERYEKPVYLLFPVTNYKIDKWREYVGLLVATDQSVVSVQNDLVDYILAYDTDYDF